MPAELCDGKPGRSLGGSENDESLVQVQRHTLGHVGGVSKNMLYYNIYIYITVKSRHSRVACQKSLRHTFVVQSDVSLMSYSVIPVAAADVCVSLFSGMGH